MPKLISTRGPTQGRKYELEEVSILGRSPSCQVYIGDLTVSRQHARVVKTPRGFLVEDLSSGNGTYVNEHRVSQHLLQHNDQIRISEVEFRFEADEPAEERWVNMVTVIAGNEPGLITVDTRPRGKLHETLPDVLEEDLRADLARTHRMLETTYAIAEATSTVLDPHELFAKILDYLLDVFADADRGFIMLQDEHQQLVPAAIRRRRGRGHGGGGLIVSQSVVNQVMHEGKSVLSTRDGSSGRATLAPHSSAAAKMCAPLAAQGDTLGILHIEGREGGKPFTQEDLDLLTGIARQAGVFILNARMHQRLLQQQRLQQDLRFARQVQQSFLPLEPPELPGYGFARHYTPYFDVGGDFYDFVPLPGGQIGISIGDVSGKGVSAALLMARLTSDMRYYAISEAAPARVLESTNRSLVASVQDNMFATVTYMVLDTRAHTLTMSNAGHIPPLLRSGHDGQVMVLDEAGNLALGVLPEPGFEQYTTELEPGDTLLLCTDGVVEAKNMAQEEYGVQRLRRAFAAAGAEAPLDGIMKDLRHFSGNAPQYDDITLVSFARTPP